MGRRPLTQSINLLINLVVFVCLRLKKKCAIDLKEIENCSQEKWGLLQITQNPAAVPPFLG